MYNSSNYFHSLYHRLLITSILEQDRNLHESISFGRIWWSITMHYFLFASESFFESIERYWNIVDWIQSLDLPIIRQWNFTGKNSLDEYILKTSILYFSNRLKYSIISTYYIIYYYFNYSSFLRYSLLEIIPSSRIYLRINHSV